MRFLLSPCEAGRNTQVLSRRARHRPALPDRRARALSPSVRLPFCAREGGERPGLGDPSTLVSISATTGKLPAGSACSDIHMALCAVNLAECAEEKIPPSTLVEIHLTAAMGLKTRCGGKLGFLAVSTCSPGSQPLPAAPLARSQDRCGPCPRCRPPGGADIHSAGHSASTCGSDRTHQKVPLAALHKQDIWVPRGKKTDLVMWSNLCSGVSMDSCFSSDYKNSWNILAVLCLLVLLFAQKVSVGSFVLITALWIQKWKTVHICKEPRSDLGGEGAVIRRLGNSQLADSQALLAARSQRVLSLGFLLLQQKWTFYSVPTSGGLLHTSAVFKTE